MTDASDREASVHRSHKAPESVRNLLERLGFKRPENPLSEPESPESSLDTPENE
jgi:hypothetical protein